MPRAAKTDRIGKPLLSTLYYLTDHSIWLSAEVFPLYGNNYLSTASNRQAEREGSTRMKVATVHHSVIFGAYCMYDRKIWQFGGPICIGMAIPYWTTNNLMNIPIGTQLPIPVNISGYTVYSIRCFFFPCRAGSRASRSVRGSLQPQESSRLLYWNEGRYLHRCSKVHRRYCLKIINGLWLEHAIFNLKLHRLWEFLYYIVALCVRLSIQDLAIVECLVLRMEVSLQMN